MKHAALAMAILLACVGMAHAGTRADASGDVVVTFATTMDMPLMNVGDTGNAADGTGYGAVGYDYSIGKFEVTAGQYTEFLNAVAATDTYTLYNLNMDVAHKVDGSGCQIIRSGTPGSYTYSVAADFADRPVNFIHWADAARFANWVHNGMPSGTQDLTTTEDGSYFLNGETVNANLALITREVDATYVIPTEDEWYKAAYYDAGTTSYFTYGTGSNTLPSNTATDPDPGNNATFYDPDTAAGPTLTATDGSGTPYNRTEAGEHENSASPYDVFDMSGNVKEMTDTLYSATKRVHRGGHYNLDYNADAQISSAVRQSGFSISYSFVLGFRLVNLGEESLPGDFDEDGDVDTDDIDILCDNLGDPAFDLDGDNDADADDFIYLIQNLVELTDGSGRTGTEVGDFDLNGLINATDLATMAANFGATPPPDLLYGDGNANCDNLINATDLAVLAANFGYVAPAGVVPEPFTMSLLGLGGLGLLKRRRIR